MSLKALTILDTTKSLLSPCAGGLHFSHRLGTQASHQCHFLSLSPAQSMLSSEEAQDQMVDQEDPVWGL